MKIDRFQEILKKSIEIGATSGMGNAVRYLRRNGINPTQRMVNEIYYSARKAKVLSIF